MCYSDKKTAENKFLASAGLSAMLGSLAQRASVALQYHAAFLGLPLVRLMSLATMTIAFPGRKILETLLKIRRDP